MPNMYVMCGISGSGKTTLSTKIAKENNVNYLFEASVGGGIPIIRPLYQCLAGNDITSVKGILNGTTNYILTKMFKDLYRLYINQRLNHHFRPCKFAIFWF